MRSPKTEHHEGKASRIVPLFPELLQPLLDLRAATPADATYVINRYRGGCNLNPHLRRIIGRAGLKPWERTWHNMRASRQTELATSYPLHTVCAWLGNTKAIAAGHYLQITDGDWQRAVGSTGSALNAAPSLAVPFAGGDAVTDARAAHKPTQQQTVPTCTGSHFYPQLVVGTGLTQPDANRRDLVHFGEMGSPGLEPGTPAFSMLCSTN